MNEITGAHKFYIPKKVDYAASKKMFLNLPANYYQIIADLRAKDWAFYAVNQMRGYCSYKAKVILIPVWALIKSESYRVWYIGHELAHTQAPGANHGPAFMTALKRIVPDNAIHHELGYKPMHASKAGIYDTSGI